MNSEFIFTICISDSFKTSSILAQLDTLIGQRKYCFDFVTYTETGAMYDIIVETEADLLALKLSIPQYE